MADYSHKAESQESCCFLTRLRRDKAGNTLVVLAAGLFPLLALVGGSVDMGRNYLAQTRLQKACDSGVLAARRKLGTQAAVDGVVPPDVAATGNMFFNLNFRDGAFGTEDRRFEMTVEPDFSIQGQATANVPTTVMKLFGYDRVDLTVECEAQLTFANTDVMFVLDTTGSMASTNPGDTQPRINVLRNTVHNFVKEMEANNAAGVRLRYGFVPYSNNVNVGFLLKSDWLVDRWSYRGRESTGTGQFETYETADTTYTYISGTRGADQTRTSFYCGSISPSTTILDSGTNPDGSTYGTAVANGTEGQCYPRPDGIYIDYVYRVYSNYKYSWVSGPKTTKTREIKKWLYRPMEFATTFVKGSSGDETARAGSIDVPMLGDVAAPSILTARFRGCIEERDTYEIGDYDNVDFSRALDLDLDTVPTPGKPDTQWRPLLHEIGYEPELGKTGYGIFNDAPVLTSKDYGLAVWMGTTDCPAPAQKLQEMSLAQVDAYTATLQPEGSTYHDIGMIWGGRLLSPTGLFASENANVGGTPTQRHLIFLTDGDTATYEPIYGAYGIEPLDKRRWNPSNPKGGFDLTQVVENRFAVACQEVKKRGITIWVIAFGTTINPIMTQCAGQGQYFEAANSAELGEAFSKIVKQIGNLRLSK